MTMPHLSNCPHQGKGWCLECVGKLHNEIEDLKHAAKMATFSNATAVGQAFLEGLEKDCPATEPAKLDAWHESAAYRALDEYPATDVVFDPNTGACNPEKAEALGDAIKTLVRGDVVFSAETTSADDFDELPPKIKKAYADKPIDRSLYTRIEFDPDTGACKPIETTPTPDPEKP
jgi:hypothetical protein